MPECPSTASGSPSPRAWLGVGVAVYAAFAALTASGVAANWSPSVRVVLLPCVMLVILAAEAGAVITARQRGGAGQLSA
jgi:hypothetical protein